MQGGGAVTVGQIGRLVAAVVLGVCILAIAWMVWAGIVAIVWLLLEWALGIGGPTPTGCFAIAAIYIVVHAIPQAGKVDR